ncbi:unnamed protein product [Effrenium voratum]|uniref:Uncharacterized protein n=1 Tax=Effrenium voratum TaxID=2562239 RepID=A0AA36ISS0_9DINO|nr:unnamed protein product [Effrenium voratum]
MQAPPPQPSRSPAGLGAPAAHLGRRAGAPRPGRLAAGRLRRAGRAGATDPLGGAGGGGGDSGRGLRLPKVLVSTCSLSFGWLTGCFAEVSCIESSCVALKSPGVSAQLLACSPSPCCTVLGLGFSASFAQPCVEGKAIASAGRRSCVGGRILTNLLMESLKLRHLDLSKAWLTVEDIFTKTCRVATDIRLEEGEPVNYVLPDFQERLQGFVAAEVPEGAQSITLTRERCVIPEALFRPQDHGIPAAGLAELVHQAILAVPEMLRPHLGRVVLCGGLARLPNLPRRLRAELRRLLPSHWPVEILLEDHPELSVWRGAAQHALHAGHSEAAAATPGVSGASPSARRGRGRGKGAVSRAGSAKMPSGKSPAQRKRPPSTISADVEAEEDAAALPTGAVSLGEPESTPAPRLKRISRKMSVEGKSAA